MVNKTTNNKISILNLKMVAILYSSILYTILACVLSFIINKLFGNFDPIIADKKSLMRLTTEIILQVTIITISVYVARNIVERIPFPLDHTFGFDYIRVKEVTNAFVFALIFMRWQYNLKEKMNYMYKRFSKTLNI